MTRRPRPEPDRIAPSRQTPALSPGALRLMEGTADHPPRTRGRRLAAAMLVHERPRVVTARRSSPVRHGRAVTPSSAGGVGEPAAGETLPTSPLAYRPIVAPEVLLRRQPFRRHVEESRPYLVLSEGMRMINAHPIAAMVFWGGLANWVLRAVLTGHQVAGLVRPLVLTVFLAGWLLITLSRLGKLSELRESMRAIRGLSASEATWAGLESRECAVFAGRLSALEEMMRLDEAASASDPLPFSRCIYPVFSATTPEQLQFPWRLAGGESARQGKEHRA